MRHRRKLLSVSDGFSTPDLISDTIGLAYERAGTFMFRCAAEDVDIGLALHDSLFDAVGPICDQVGDPFRGGSTLDPARPAARPA